MDKLFANSGDPDQTPHSAASDLGLHCLPFTLLGVSRLQWVKTAFVSPKWFLSYCSIFNINPCPAEPGYVLLLKTVQIQISRLLKKPTNLDLHCLSISK